jgi:hypothetical protein
MTRSDDRYQDDYRVAEDEDRLAVSRSLRRRTNLQRGRPLEEGIEPRRYSLPLLSGAARDALLGLVGARLDIAEDGEYDALREAWDALDGDSWAREGNGVRPAG